MSEKISVLDIKIDKITAKAAMKKCISYMDSEPLNVVEVLKVDDLMRMEDEKELKEQVSAFELVLAGDKAILEAANIEEKKSLQETENRTFLKMFLCYLHKNRKRVYLLMDAEADSQTIYEYLQWHYKSVDVVGMARVAAKDRADDMLINAINGGEVDCVISLLSTPLQEAFITKNRGLLNARVWLGIGKDGFLEERQKNVKGKISQFIIKHIFKKEIEKRKKSEQLYAVK